MKNMKKLVALFAATVMTLSFGVSAFAATVNTDASDYDTTDETVFNLVFTPGENEAAQMTMIAYLVDDETDPANIPAYDGQEVVAIDQVGGDQGFGEVPVDVAKLEDGYAIAVAIGGTGINTAAKYLVTYNKEANTMEIIIGDIDLNTIVNANDAAALTQYLAIPAANTPTNNNRRKTLLENLSKAGFEFKGKESYDLADGSGSILVGDIDLNTIVNANDAAALTQYLAIPAASTPTNNNRRKTLLENLAKNGFEFKGKQTREVNQK